MFRQPDSQFGCRELRLSAADMSLAKRFHIERKKSIRSTGFKT